MGCIISLNRRDRLCTVLGTRDPVALWKPCGQRGILDTGRMQLHTWRYNDPPIVLSETSDDRSDCSSINDSVEDELYNLTIIDANANGREFTLFGTETRAHGRCKRKRCLNVHITPQSNRPDAGLLLKTWRARSSERPRPRCCAYCFCCVSSLDAADPESDALMGVASGELPTDVFIVKHAEVCEADVPGVPRSLVPKNIPRHVFD